MRKLGRSFLVWFCSGAIFMVTLGPIVAGAIGACFWYLPSDGQRDDMMAATRLLNLSGVDPANFPVSNLRYRILGHHSECPVWQIAKMKNASDDDSWTNVIWDVDIAERDRIADAAHSGPFMYLLGLPRPILGSLDYCVAHTLLAPVCASIIRSMMQRHAAEFVSQFEKNYALARARHDAEFCVLKNLNGKKYLPTNRGL